MTLTFTRTMMQTFTGRVIDLSNFGTRDVDIVDIAHSLAILNRFTGHSVFPYSVAQHSLLVSSMLPPQLALNGLLHDASEAYLGDVARPLKAMLPAYKELELHVQQVIADVFGLEWPMPKEVHAADNAALLCEKRDLLSVDWDWGIHVEGGTPVAGVKPENWVLVKQMFLDRYEELAA